MSNRSLKMLKTALDMEEKGMKFYEEAIAKCKNDLGREIFTTLRADEVVHVERIKAIYTSIEGKDRWTDEWTKFAPSHGALKPLFRDCLLYTSDAADE